MALTIKTEKGVFNISNDFNIEIEITSPIYNNVGSRTIGSTLPGTKHNLSLINHIHRLDIANAPEKDRMIDIADGVYRRTGKLNIPSPSKDGIVCNIGFDESLMYAAWSNISLKKLPGLPVYKPDGGLNSLIDHLEKVYEYREEADYYVFPVQVSNETSDDIVYPEIINPIIKIKESEGGLPAVWEMKKEARTEQIIVSGKVTSVKLPAGYGISPFLKVSRVLELIFSAYGYRILENPFSTDYQLKKMVVLNNVADTIVEGFIDYKDIMPDCTINDFLEALFCRTGAEIYVNGNNKTARIMLLKDSVKSEATDDWTLLRTSHLKPTYNAPKQLKITAGTSFDNASPANDNFEDFYTKYSGQFTEWVNSDIENIPNEYYLIFQPTTGNYYKNNLISGKKEWLSSDFFPWDQKTPDIEYEEITGNDECVPMGFSPSLVLCPQYLAGSTHFHTTLRRAPTTEKEDKKETPLAFCFAIGMGEFQPGREDQPSSSNKTGYYHGSSLCIDLSGLPFVDPDRNRYQYSLTFTGKYGAFNRFFKEWDAILRHANTVYDGEMNLDKSRLSRIDTSRPILIGGQKLMIDNIKHSLPSSKDKPATVKLRSLKLLKPYNLDEEQSLPVFRYQSTKWEIVSYADEVLDARIQELEKKYPATPTSSAVAVNFKKELITKPDDEDFASFLPPSEDDLLQGKEIMNTYKGKLSYNINHYFMGKPDGTTHHSEELDYNAGIKAAPITL